MLMMLNAELKKPAELSNSEFYSVWLREAEIALEAMRTTDKVKALWKIAGKHSVIAVFDVDSADELDELLLGMPVFAEGYSHIVAHLEWNVLREYASWAEQLERLSGEQDNSDS